VHGDLAAKLTTAFNARDNDALRSLVAEDATWGDDPGGESFCHDRAGIVRHLEQLLAEGLRPTIVDTTTGPGGIAARFAVEWPGADEGRAGRSTVAQVYVVTSGLVAEIHGHDDMASAVAAVSR
jgi:hypothetical protein